MECMNCSPTKDQMLKSEERNLMENAKLDGEEECKKLDEMKGDNVSQGIDEFKQKMEEMRQKIIEYSKLNFSQKLILERNEKQMAIDKTKINCLVTKIDEMIKNPSSMLYFSQRGKMENESFRKIKQMEFDLIRERSKYLEKVVECNDLQKDYEHLEEVNKELRAELELRNNTINELMVVNLNNAAMRQSRLDTDLTKVTEWTSLEGKVEILKGKEHHRVDWVPSFAVLKPFKLNIFQNETDHIPSLSIDLRSVFHIKSPSPAECVHIDRSLLPRIIQVIYEKEETNDDQIQRQWTVSFNMGEQIHPNSISDDESNTFARPISVVDMNTQNGIFKIENHSFVQRRFRWTTNCDLCHQMCSAFFNPPEALECIDCKRCIHAEHIYNNNYKIQWCQGAIEMVLLKVNSEDAKFVWLNCLIQLKESQKMSEVQVAPDTFYRNFRHPVPSSLANLSIH